jgi:hypothetical protein
VFDLGTFAADCVDDCATAVAVFLASLAALEVLDNLNETSTAAVTKEAHKQIQPGWPVVGTFTIGLSRIFKPSSGEPFSRTAAERLYLPSDQSGDRSNVPCFLCSK